MFEKLFIRKEPGTGGKRKYFKYGAFFFGALLLIGLLPRIKRAKEMGAIGRPDITAVHTGLVIQGRPESEVLLPGDARAIFETSIFARIDGYVRARRVEIGDQVSAGQLLLEIDSPEIQGQYSDAKARFEKAKSNLELARITWERWQRLVAQNAVSRQEADQKQADYESKKADMNAAEADVRRYTEMYSYLRITAPFAGIITDRDPDLEVGNLVTLGSSRSSRALFRIANREILKIFVHVPQLYAGSVHDGEFVDLIVPESPGKSSKGQIAHLAHALDPDSRTMLMEVHVPNTDHSLLPGMFIQAKLKIRQNVRTLLAPSSALIFSSQGVAVAKVQANSVIHMQLIEIGRDFGETVEIISGLSEGNRVVINPSDSLEEGMTVKLESSNENQRQTGEAQRQTTDHEKP